MISGGIEFELLKFAWYYKQWGLLIFSLEPLDEKIQMSG